MRSTVDGWRRQMVEEGETARCESRSLRPASDLEFYTIEVNPESLADPKERKFVQSVSTSFNLDAEVGGAGCGMRDAGCGMRDAGAQLLRQSEVDQQLLRDLRPAEGP